MRIRPGARAAINAHIQGEAWDGRMPPGSFVPSCTIGHQAGGGLPAITASVKKRSTPIMR